MQKIKLGIVGCGPIGTQAMYAPILRYLENGIVTSCMDINHDNLKIMKEDYGINDLYTDYDNFLSNADVDAVIICSPTYLHGEQVIKAAEHKKHILCEKPMARTVKECDNMIESCKKNNVKLMIALMKRFDKSFIFVKEMLKQKELGSVFQIKCDWSWFDPTEINWRTRIDNMGGIFQDHGSHTIDLCYWWLGEVKTVSGTVRILSENTEVEDLAVATLEHENGAISTHTMTRNTHKALNEYYLIDGTKASLEIQFPNYWSYYPGCTFEIKKYLKGKQSIDLTQYNVRNFDFEQRNNRYKNEIDYFCKCLLNNLDPEIDGLHGRKIIEIINAVYISSFYKEKVTLPIKEGIDLKEIFRKTKLNYKFK